MSVLPSIVSPALLSYPQSKSSTPTHHKWYFIAATILSILNRPNEIPKFSKYAMDYGAGATGCKPAHEDQLF